jgi:2-deoxy-D-gluconate 3-dehydrogenase
MSGRFQDKVALVTGASRGIGQSIAQALSREGAKVIGVARTIEAGDGVEARPFDFLAASVDDMRDLVQEICDRFERLDILVNNAGIIRRAPALEFSEQDWNDVLKVNLTAPFFLSQAAARWWIESGNQQLDRSARLKIINIASMLSFQGGINIISYTAAKHGLAGITKALANEWASQRINVNAIAPGYITTENTRALRENETRNRQIIERIPHGDWGNPQDITGGVMFLASKDSDYMNGAVINIDGGWLAR